MWGSQEKILGHKVNEKIFRVDPGRKNSNKVNKMLFPFPLLGTPPLPAGRVPHGAGRPSLQGSRLSCRMLQIDEKIADDDLRFKVIITITMIGIALPLLLTY